MAGDPLMDELLIFCRIVQAHAERLCKDEGLSPQQWLLLDMVRRMSAADSGRPMLSSLATMLKVSRANMTKLARQLSDKGLIEASDGSRDGRVLWLRLTTKGKSLHQRLALRSRKWQDRVQQQMGVDKLEQMQELTRLFFSDVPVDEKKTN